MKKGVLKNFVKFTKTACARVFFLIKFQPEAYNFIEKETLAQLFPSEFYQIFKHSFFTEHIRVTASICVAPVNITWVYDQISFTALRQIPKFHLTSWCGNFVKRHSFRGVSGDENDENDAINGKKFCEIESMMQSDTLLFIIVT